MKIDWKEKIVWFRTGKGTRTGIYFADIGREVIPLLVIVSLVIMFSILDIIALIMLLLEL